MERRVRRTISISPGQPSFDFEIEPQGPFTFPDYQKTLWRPRLLAGVTDFAIVAGIYLLFVIVTFLEMPDAMWTDRRTLAIYGAGYILFVAVYFFLFMLSASQTPGMKLQGLVVVDAFDNELSLPQASLRGFGYLISICPLMLGFIWALIDPDHVTWADKVSGTYVRRI